MVPYAESIMLPNSFRVKCTLLLNKFQVTGICLWRLKEGIKSALYTQTHHCEAASLQSSFYTLIGAALATYFHYLVLLPLRANICTCSFLHWFTKVTTDCTTSVQRWNGFFFFFFHNPYSHTPYWCNIPNFRGSKEDIYHFLQYSLAIKVHLKLPIK